MSRKTTSIPSITDAQDTVSNHRSPDTARPSRQELIPAAPPVSDCPSVTVVIPTYNEAAHIERVVSRFVQTSYPNLVEVLVVDGGSTDGTREVVQRLSGIDSRVRLLPNPLKIQSAGLNIGLAEMHGEVFIRADGHSQYAEDYVEQCVNTLLRTKALNVGGVQRFAATTAFQAGTALASRSILGNGGSKHRDPNHNGTSDTVFLGCWWKRDLEKLDSGHLPSTIYATADLGQKTAPSFFDLEQVANQDSELNVRFRKLDSEAIYVSSTIKAWYFPRKTWHGLRKQYFNYGRGRCRTAAVHPDLSPARAQLPLFAGIGALLLGAIDRFVFRGKLRTTHLFWLASVLPFVESLRVTLTHRRRFESDIWRGPEDATPSLFQRWLYCSVALWTMTPSYLMGYLYQLCRRKFLGVDGW